MRSGRCGGGLALRDHAHLQNVTAETHLVEARHLSLLHLLAVDEQPALAALVGDPDLASREEDRGMLLRDLLILEAKVALLPASHSIGTWRKGLGAHQGPVPENDHHQDR